MSTEQKDESRPFRERVRDRLAEKLGEPRAISTGEGRFFYRWILERPYGLSIYITLDSPEIEHIGHILVSDPRAGVNPVASITMRTLAEVDEAVEGILKQWRG